MDGYGNRHEPRGLMLLSLKAVCSIKFSRCLRKRARIGSGGGTRRRRVSLRCPLLETAVMRLGIDRMTNARIAFHPIVKDHDQQKDWRSEEQDIEPIWSGQI